MNGEREDSSTTAATAEPSAARSTKLHREFEATLGARQELGERYDEELIDGFLRRLDQSVDEHIEHQMNHGASAPRQPRAKRRNRRSARLLIAAFVLSIPLFAFSASFGAFMGLFFGIGSHQWIVGFITAVLVTIGSFSAVALALAVGALIYLDRTREA